MAKKNSRKERERLAHREEILDVAEEIFAKKGFMGTSIQDISEKADFSIGKIYQLFESKERIYDEVIRRRLDEVYEVTIKAVSGAANTPAMLRETLKAQFAYLEEHRSLVHLFFRETIGFKMRMRGLLGESLYSRYDDYQEVLLEVFAKGVEEGFFPEEEPLDLMLGYTGIVFSFLSYHLDKNPKADLVALVPRIERIFYERMAK